MNLSGQPLHGGDREISARQSEIAELVRSEGFVSIEDLAVRFGVTAQTIRKNVNGLSDLGMLRRVHGGVQTANHGNLEFQTREVLRLAEKRRIAAAVAAMIPNGASLALSIGTTPLIVARALAGHARLRILTNNLHAAFAVRTIDSVEVSIPGGAIRLSDGDIVGQPAVEFFSRFQVDFGIFGVAAVGAGGELLDFHEEEVAARQAVMENCRQSFLVLDGSKFARQAHVRGGSIADVDHVFSDVPPPQGIADRLRAARVSYSVCGEETL